MLGVKNIPYFFAQLKIELLLKYHVNMIIQHLFNITMNSSCNLQFKSPSYSNFILSNLYQLWIKQELTDLKFIISNKIFHVHRYK